MKKLSVSVALVVMALTAQAQDSAVINKSDLNTTSAVSRFVQHPYNCQQMLGGGNDGDLLPASFSVAQNASLNDSGIPAEQTLALIQARCVQQVSAQGQQNPMQQVSALDRRNLN